MPKKVYELAKELGVASKDLLDKAAKLGIDVTNHMSVLSDADVRKLSAKNDRTAARPAGVPGQVPGHKGPMGRPIVSDSYFENKRKAPVGKPIVDSDFLAKREKAKTEEKEAAAAEKTKEVKKEEAKKQEKPASSVKTQKSVLGRLSQLKAQTKTANQRTGVTA